MSREIAGRFQRWFEHERHAHEKVLRSLELFAEHVMPHFRDRPPTVPRELRDEVSAIRQ